MDQKYKIAVEESIEFVRKLPGYGDFSDAAKMIEDGIRLRLEGKTEDDTERKAIPVEELKEAAQEVWRGQWGDSHRPHSHPAPFYVLQSLGNKLGIDILGLEKKRGDNDRRGD
ncbi:MAG: hypothetical protein GWM98_04565 [Nitrospinaceae bacterium]|nr:hypothetical protein [Deltaproteobacteria bacterium]NIY14192.1 hypothetical protein [Nitrospinaceae bacterium]